MPPEARGAALLLAGDAAFGLRAYTRAAERYGEFVSGHALAREAPQAALAQGWAELRLGHLDRARRTWSQIARSYPLDERAPLALLLAAHVAAQGNDLSTARRWLDHVVGGYSTSPSAIVARLSRSILAVRQGNEQEAARDLRDLLEASQWCAAQERHTLLQGLAAGDVRAPSMRVNGHDCHIPPAGMQPIERFAAPFLNGAGDPETTPLVLHGLVYLAAEDRRWAEVRVLSGDLVAGFPTYPATTGLLMRIAGQAASDREWPIARGAYEQILARSPSANPLGPRARLDFAEALLRTGAPDAARAQLAQLARIDQEHGPRRLFLLGEATEALGRPHEALATYDRLRRDHPRSEWTAESLLPRARLLQAVGQRQQARTLLQEILKGADGEVFGEAAFRLAESLRGDGQHALALKWYLTAAHVSADSPWGQRAELGALQGLLATGDRAAADAIYRRMLTSSTTDPDLLTQARNALQARPPDR